MAFDTIQSQPRTDDDASTVDVLRRTAELALSYQSSIPTRRVGADPAVTSNDLRRSLGGPLPRDGADAWTVVQELAADVEPGLVTDEQPALLRLRHRRHACRPPSPPTGSTSVWDQNAGPLRRARRPPPSSRRSPVRWLLELLGLPADATVGFTSGATMANVTGVAAGRHAVLRRVGWDVEEDGLSGAPTIRVIVGADVHVSMLPALRYVGLGRGRAERVPDRRRGPDGCRVPWRRSSQGRDEPTIVCAQLGEVNTGAFDPIGRIVDGRPRAIRTRGCMSMARSACGPPPAHGCARWSTVTTAPTLGRPTPTSG